MMGKVSEVQCCIAVLSIWSNQTYLQSLYKPENQADREELWNSTEAFLSVVGYWYLVLFNISFKYSHE